MDPIGAQFSFAASNGNSTNSTSKSFSGLKNSSKKSWGQNWGQSFLIKTYLKSLIPRWTRVLAAERPEMPPPIIINLEKLSAYSWPSAFIILTFKAFSWHFSKKKLMFSFSCLWTEHVTDHIKDKPDFIYHRKIIFLFIFLSK